MTGKRRRLGRVLRVVFGPRAAAHALAACDRLGAGDGRSAVDLGWGEGTDALALLDRGWSVLAIDIEPAGLASLRGWDPGGLFRTHPHRVHVIRRCRPLASAPDPCRIQPALLPPRQFPAVLAQIRRALVPGAIFAGQLFGTGDSWADDPGLTFQNRAEVLSLLNVLRDPRAARKRA